MKELEKVIRERWFKNHKATLTTMGNLQVLEWKEPGTSIYSCRYVFDGNRMYISGDIGSAVFDLTWKADVHSFNKLSIGYFESKMDAFSDDRRDFSSEKAVKRLREWLTDIKYDGIDYDHEEMKELFENARFGSYKWEWIETIHLHEEFIRQLDPDFWEWMSSIGDEIPARVYGYLMGLQMGSEQLRSELLATSEPTETKVDVIPLPDDGPRYELTVPVKLKFSNQVKDTSFIRKGVLNALIAWSEDGPGFISDLDNASGSYTTGIEVDEVIENQLSEEQANEENDVFTTIRWIGEDLIQAFNNAHVDPNPENIQRFKESRAPRTLADRSVEEGWVILGDLITDMFGNMDDQEEEGKK